MYSNPKTDYEKGFNAGFLTHGRYVANSQIKRMTEENEKQQSYLQEKWDEFYQSIGDKETFELFKTLLNRLQERTK